MFHKKAILKNFVTFTGKCLCWGFFFIKVAGLQVSNCIKNVPEEHLRTTAAAFLEIVL